ncbi:MAG TPA: DNA polymerase III subunit gamma/tau [Gemmatimonadales bacterium]|jgi:DNA polymerase-3 subunit gamma/tau|nr:DNA polymerase III subunit gamma/tau [Gemmatimonadales bacterium]
MTISLARRYRPKRFADLLVQDHVAAVLRGAVAQGRVGHGYLLTGPRGVGKTTAARILAMALNCPNRDAAGDPCGECESCVRIWTGSANLDVVEIDAASNRGVDDARELRERAMYAASQEGHHKIYIVDEAHMLTREAWNALLKILEEPPPGVVFVFATTEPRKIESTAAPIMSRLQRFDFRRIGPAAIRDRLRAVLDAEGISAEDDALTLIARHADGGMRDALSLLDQCLSLGEGRITAERVRETLGLPSDELLTRLLRALVEHDAAAIFALVDDIVESGADPGEFMNTAAEWLRARLMLSVNARPEGLTEAARAALESVGDALGTGDVLRMLKLLADQEAALRRSAQPRLVAETLLLRWALMDRTVDLEEVLAGRGTRDERRAPDAGRRTPDRRRQASVATSQASDVRRQTSDASRVPRLESDFSLPGLSAVWSSVVEQVRERSRFLAEALSASDLVAVEAPQVVVALREPNPIFQESLEQKAADIEGVIVAIVGAPVRLEVQGSPTASAPVRRTEAAMRAERLQGLRRRDPALDAAADELDLEIVE